MDPEFGLNRIHINDKNIFNLPKHILNPQTIVFVSIVVVYQCSISNLMFLLGVLKQIYVARFTLCLLETHPLLHNKYIRG